MLKKILNLQINQSNMKKLGLLSLLLAISIAGCNKDKKDIHGTIMIDIRLKDSLGNYVFPYLPPSVTAAPFDPRNSFWLDGHNTKQELGLGGTNPLSFFMIMTEPEVEQQPGFEGDKMLHWKVFFHPDSVPINVTIYHPTWNTDDPEYVVWNTDTFVLRGKSTNVIQPIYP